MLRAIGWVLKLTAFTVVVLVLANWIQWRGKTISDQVKTQMSQAHRSGIAESVRSWANRLATDARKGARQQPARMAAGSSDEDEDIRPSERQKLKALIQELNRSKSD